ncbi:MAG: DNA primase [Coriobacteriia bacterium]|nr:DNA primase [Coriobacteriia bacterium]
MGRISDEDVARVRDATDLVSLVAERVPLKQKGRLFWGNCPFHGEKTPSFKVDPGRQDWHCFGCGAHGDAFGYLMRMESMDFPDAVRLLADRARVEIHESEGGVPRGYKDRLYAVLAESADFYHKSLVGSREQGATKAREYLKHRGFGSEVAKRWQLGFSLGRGSLVRHLTQAGFTPEEMVDANVALRGDDASLKDRFYERVMFPISDIQGRIVAFGGRVVGTGEPKYLNTNDTPVFHKSANMYGIERAKAAITSSGDAVVVEGYTDVIALHEAGVQNAVATLGTALTQQHVRLLGRFARRVVYLFDGDEAGMRAADRAVEFVDRTLTPEAGGGRVDLLVAMLPSGTDPADYVAAQGVDALGSVVAAAEPLLQFAIDRRLARWDLDRPEERARALTEAAAVLAPVKDSILADDYANYIADRLFADFTTVKRAIGKATASPRQAEEVAAVAPRSKSGLQPPVSGEAKAERDTVALLVRTPSLRGRAQELLAEGLVSDVFYIRMLEAVLEAPPATTSGEMIELIEQRVTGASTVLGAAEARDSGIEPEALFDSLESSLKEFALERRIAAAKGLARSEEVVKDPARYDEIFREVSEMQRQLDTLKRSRRT